MTQDVVGILVGARQWHDDAFLEALRDPAGAFPDGTANSIGLLEVRIVGIENDGLALVELAQEGPAVALVPPLGHARGILHRLPFFGVQIEFEMVRFERLELEVVVLHLVATEILRLRCDWEKAADEEGHCQDAAQSPG